MDIAILYQRSDNQWVSKGWYRFAPAECASVLGGDLRNRFYYVYAKRDDSTEWNGNGEDGAISGCVTSAAFEHPQDQHCDSGRTVLFSRIDTGEALDYRLNLTHRSETVAEVKTGQIHTRCLARWDDSHQVHSVETIVRWNYQAVKTKMKKLEHCIRLDVTGPVDIEGVAKSYVDQCINEGLNHNKTTYALKALLAIGADVWGSGGAATSAVVADYVSSVTERTLGCLTDTDRISDYFADQLKARFDASVRSESHWVYWDL